MPQPTKGARLGGSPAHQRHILANLATALFQHGRITTTEAKARKLRPYAEKLITKAKRGDLHNIREIAKVIRSKDVVHQLVSEIGPFFSDRQGGYTRITKTLARKGDNAPMAVIELIRQKTVTDEADRARRVSASQAAPAAPAETVSAEPADAASVSAEPADAASVSAEPADAASVAEEASDKALDAAVAAEPGSVAEEKALDAAESAEEAAEAASADDAVEGPYGAGSHAPLADPSQAPEGFPVKGNEDSKLYHDPDSPHYGRTVAEVWFADPETAEAAGFALPKSQQSQDDGS